MDLTLKDLRDINSHLSSHRVYLVDRLEDGTWMDDKTALEQARSLQSLGRVFDKTIKLQSARQAEVKENSNGTQQ